MSSLSQFPILYLFMTNYEFRQQVLSLLSAYDINNLAIAVQCIFFDYSNSHNVIKKILSDHEEYKYLIIWRDIFKTRIWLNKVQQAGYKVTLWGRDLKTLRDRLKYSYSAQYNEPFCWKTIAITVTRSLNDHNIEQCQYKKLFLSSVRNGTQTSTVDNNIVAYINETKICLWLIDLKWSQITEIASNQELVLSKILTQSLLDLSYEGATITYLSLNHADNEQENAMITVSLYSQRSRNSQRRYDTWWIDRDRRIAILEYNGF